MPLNPFLKAWGDPDEGAYKLSYLLTHLAK